MSKFNFIFTFFIVFFVDFCLSNADAGDYCGYNTWNNCNKENFEICDFKKKECICEFSYDYAVGKCLGPFCNSDEECKTKVGSGSTCDANHCACSKRKRGLWLEGKCEKSYLGKECKSNANCNIKNKVECVLDNDDKISRCHCKLNYDRGEEGENEFECKYKKDHCSVNAQCVGENEVCKIPENKCSCRNGFWKTNDKCYQIPDYCDQDIECKKPNTECGFINKRCRCKKDYHFVDDVCKYRPAFCETNEECFGEGSVCHDNECSCLSNYKQTGRTIHYIYCKPKTMSAETIAGIVVPVVIVVICVLILTRCLMIRRQKRLSASPVFFNNSAPSPQLQMPFIIARNELNTSHQNPCSNTNLAPPPYSLANSNTNSNQDLPSTPPPSYEESFQTSNPLLNQK